MLCLPRSREIILSDAHPLSVRLGTAPGDVNNIGRNNMRVRITLACSECKQRNYDTMKNKKNDPDRLEMSKYCRFCKKHTVHKESK